MGPERVRVEYRAEWVQRGSELNTGLNGSREGQN